MPRCFSQEVKLMLPPDFENEEEEERARQELDEVRSQLQDVRRSLRENSRNAMDEFERRRRQQQLAIGN